MIYPVQITVDHNGNKIKPGGTIDLNAEQAAPLIRGGFIGPKVLNASEQEEPAKAETGGEPSGTDTGSEAASSDSRTEPVSELDRVIAAIGKIDPDKKELFTGSGKPKTEAFEGIEGIDFTVSAALRDQAWDQYQKQKAE